MPREDTLTLCFQYALAFFHANPHLPVFLSGCCNLPVCEGLPIKLAAQFILGDWAQLGLVLNFTVVPWLTWCSARLTAKCNLS